MVHRENEPIERAEFSISPLEAASYQPCIIRRALLGTNEDKDPAPPGAGSRSCRQISFPEQQLQLLCPQLRGETSLLFTARMKRIPGDSLFSILLNQCLETVK